MIIAIGDVHGTTHWKNIIAEHKKSPNDIVVFLGDYVDSFNIPPEQCLENLSELFEYKCSTPNVYMLIGNHDYHYMRHDIDRYSGYQLEWMKAYRSILLDNYHHLDIALTIKQRGGDDYVFSHAGVSQQFLDANGDIAVEQLQGLWEYNPSVFGFKHNTMDYYGNHPSQGPLWIRPEALATCAVRGYKQIVGHTNVRRPHTFFSNHGDAITIVCTEDKNGFLIIEL